MLKREGCNPCAFLIYKLIDTRNKKCLQDLLLLTSSQNDVIMTSKRHQNDVKKASNRRQLNVI